MTYTVTMTRSATKALEALDKPTRRRVWARIRALADDPRPRGVKALSQPLKGYYRLRVGQYRVVYAVDDREALVRVGRLGTRRSIHDEVERAE